MKNRFFTKIILILFVFIVYFQPVQAQEEQVITGSPEEIISQIQLSLEKNPEKTELKISFKQPIDHNSVEMDSFSHRVFLIHKDFSNPTVLWLEGYAAGRNRKQEITQILDANQIIVEHRYFGQSVPDSLDWNYLTIKQAAADHHRIVEVFKQLYSGKWISSGISKGGQTSMYHRRFYPDDVDVSVCYVAPLNFSDEEPRVYDFLGSVGSEECRTKIENFQKLALQNKEELLPLFKEYSEEKNYTYKIGFEAAFEYCVLEYSFSFWQWLNKKCSDIPEESATIQEIFDHFMAVSGPYYFSDQGISFYRPFFYQALTEIGYYGYDVSPFKDLLSVLKNPNFSFCAPEGVETKFDPSVMQDIYEWIVNFGNNMIFIYGEVDPWSASTVELEGKTNALKMVLRNGSHRTRIRSFSEENQEKIYNTLEKWLEIKIDGNF